MLTRVQKKDIGKAATVLADAFQYYPVWNKSLEGESDVKTKFRYLFEVPLLHCLKYGEVYATSENFEGVMGWLPGRFSDMTIWRIIRSGALLASMKIGINPAKRLVSALEPLNKDRSKFMAGRDYLYLNVVGVTTNMQGKGYGRQLIGAAIEKAEHEGMPLYLETETDENVIMYQHFGFRILQKVMLPVIDLPSWELLRDSGK